MPPDVSAEQITRVLHYSSKYNLKRTELILSLRTLITSYETIYPKLISTKYIITCVNFM